MRELAGLSPFELGIAVGLSEQDILAYEAGRRVVSVPRLRAIALACGTSSARLLASSPLSSAVSTSPLWRELGTLFAQMSRPSREALVHHARQLLERER